jgi:16S rRNA (guanine527-N7)-methyltransferase
MSLIDVLERSQELGFLGPNPVEAHVAHALGFAGLVEKPPARFLDLGSGGGVPGLVLAVEAWPSATGVLLDAGERRVAFLEEAVEGLGLTSRLTVVRSRAETAGRDEALRGSVDVVVARSFAAPPVTAECAAPFLRAGGTLVVSEPPAELGRGDRWPAPGLALVGLEPVAAVAEPHAFRSFRQEIPCSERYPRREGIPSKRPLW